MIQQEAAWEMLFQFLKATVDEDWDKEPVMWEFESDTPTDYDFSKNTRRA